MILGKLDRYIIGKFLSTFFFTVLIFSMVSLIIDWSEKVERFIESDITKMEIAFEYFPTFLLFILGLLWPMLTLISVIFFTSRMAGNSEIISILNAGVSFRRLLRPYLFSASILTLLYLVGIHFIIPIGNEHRQELERTYFSRNRDEGKTRNVHMFVAPDTKVYINFYRKRDSTARDFRLETYHDQELVALTKARHAKYIGAKDKWELHNYEIRTFDGTNETLESGLGKTLDTLINLHPNDFVDYKEQQSTMTTPQLVQHIKQQRSRGSGNVRKYEVELARRTAEPFTVFILTLIGVAVAGRKVRGGMGIQLATGMFIGALFVFLSRFSSTISSGTNIPVLLGMWLPNLLFFGAALIFIRNAQK
ncbi:MAG: LptF/LptG family permease [Bacteroidota bacterium]